MKYPCFRLSQGRTIFTLLREGATSSAQKARPELREIGSAPDCDIDDVLEAVKDTLRVHGAKRMQEEGLAKDAIEGSLAVRLHSEMSVLPAQALADPDFWRYVSLEVAREFVFWRDGVNCSQASFGLQSSNRIPDCVPLRMFNRAHISRSVGSRLSREVIDVSITGGADFWQSHVLRVHNRFDPRVVAFLVARIRDRRLANVDEVREIAKRIRQERSNLVFELMGEARVEEGLSIILERMER